MGENAIASQKIKSIEDEFLSLGYERNLIRRKYSFTDFLAPDNCLRTVDLAVFGQSPPDYRSACFGVTFLHESYPVEKAIDRLRALGAPHFFAIRNGMSEWWTNSATKCVFQKEIQTSALPRLIQANKTNWEPANIIRLKSGFQKPGPQQRDFVDLGLLPALEQEASVKTDSLIKRILHNVEKRFGEQKLPLDASLIFSITFRLLTAKVLKDRNIEIQPPVDFSEPLISLRAASRYYGHSFGTELKRLPMELLKGISKEIGEAFSFQNLSVDTLTYIYENTFVSSKNRKSLGIHSTPSYVADFVLSQIPLERKPRTKWNVLDPMCGHGIFLIAAMRRMRDLLPFSWNSKQRHHFLVEKLHGIEIESFSLEVARLCLMLADFPESNSWDLQHADIFSGKKLEASVAEASIIVGNPPFENLKVGIHEMPKPAYLLRRALPAMPDGSLIGLVLPRSFLDGMDYRHERQQFLSEFQILSLTALPDKVFLHSEAETVTVVAEKRKRAAKLYTVFREVKKHHMARFRSRYDVTWEDQVPQSYFSDQLNYRLNLPMLRIVWEKFNNAPRLGDVADVKIGVQYEPEQVKGRLAELIQPKPFSGSRPAIYNVTEGFKAFVAEDTEHISVDSSLRRKRARGAWELDWHKPKIVVPASRTSRGPWRYAAAVDREGRLVSRRFYAVWPKKDEAEPELLAAVLNSPIAEAFVYAHSAQRDISARVYKSIPMPRNIMDRGNVIGSLIKSYLESLRSSNLAEAKGILIKIDSEVLALYGLPPQLEQKVLKLFLGDTRRRVPFPYTGFISTKVLPLLPENLKNQLSPRAIHFCSRKNILSHLQTALKIIFSSFSSIRAFYAAPEQDPEIHDEWLSLDITVEGEIGQVLDSYDNYVERWVASVPSTVRKSIRLSYNLL